MIPESSSPRYPQRLYHQLPGWVDAGARFHIRLRAHRENTVELTDAGVARSLLQSTRYYHDRHKWHVTLLLIMPDHVHAILSFPRLADMSRVVGDWKRYTAQVLGIRWQTNFFDHRIRTVQQGNETFHYILQNPSAKGLCAKADTWPWVFIPH